MSNSKRVGIDGDVLRYEIGAISQSMEKHFGVPVAVPHQRHTVEENVNRSIERIVERSGADSFEVFLSAGSNYRTEIAVTNPYKGQRKAPKPVHWSTVSEILLDQYAAWNVHGAEADDALSIFGRQDPDNFIVASRDKDLRIVPCWHYAWRCGDSQPEIPTHKVDKLGWVSCKAYPSGGYKLVGNGLSFFYGQVLAGDPIDNYKGCPGIGPQKAAEALLGCKTEHELWEATYRLYKAKLGPEEGLRLLTENARLAWLLDDAEVTYDGNNIYISPRSLWNPPSIPDGEPSGAIPESPVGQQWDPLPTGDDQYTSPWD